MRSVSTAFSFVMALAIAANSFAGAPPNLLATQYRNSIGEPNEATSKVKTDFISFAADLLFKRIGDRPYALTEFAGFSGADYANKDSFKKDFERRVLELVSQTKHALGESAVTVFLLGGSVDGIGVGYSIIDQLKKSGAIRDVIVGGLVSDQVVAYHLEGVEKGWGDVIAPQQDILLLMNTAKDSSGSKTWELKSTPYDLSTTVEVLVNLANWGNAGPVRLELFEGAAQSIKEGIEFLLEARNREHPVKNLELTLHIGYEAGKPAKDKGFRAARQLALLVREHPELVPENVKVRVTNVAAGGVAHSVSIDEFFLSEKGRELLSAQINLSKLYPMVTDAIAQYKSRAEHEISRSEGIIRTPSHPAHNNHSSYKHLNDDIGRNLRFIEEVSKIERRFSTTLSSCADILLGQ